jgi:5-methylcytosine-specific restriction endonuclease McrA
MRSRQTQEEMIRACGRSCEGAYCPLHDRQRLLKRQDRDRRYGYGRSHWRRLKKERLALDNYTCRIRLAGCTLRATTVHLHPDLQGNHDIATINDCISACAPCHGAIDAPRAR